MDSKKLLTALLIIVNLVGFASAVNGTTLYAYDLNTRGGIPSAEVNLMLNETHNLTEPMHTDGYGGLTYYDSGLPNYTIRINKTAYLDYFENITTGTRPQISAYLFPSTSAGIIRVRFQDMTLGAGDRTITIFFQENGRIYDVIHAGNETAVLLTQHNYTFTPTLRQSDLLSGTNNIKLFTRMYGGTLISGGTLIMALALTVIYILWHQYKR